VTTAGADPETAAGRLRIGVCLGSIGADARWWLESARRLEAAGYDGIWCWDHFISRGDRRTPVLEGWTMLTAAAARTDRIRLGTYVANVMNRHPAVLARMAATLQSVAGGRLVLGIGIGGHPAEHEALGIPFPPARERLARLEDAIGVMRALWSGGPVDRDSPFYPLRRAVAFPRPQPAPRIVIGAQTAAGTRLAARIADGWTSPVQTFERYLPAYLGALAKAGRERTAQEVLVAFEAGRSDRDALLPGTAWVESPREELERWRAAGADGAIVTARTPSDVDALVHAAAHW
jgi:alkanesulfonate monooxygenase SsuD/methylene tetrahydromethanopterin reductase-like flavin-dependent oxidoreductase (luciferase family)